MAGDGHRHTAAAGEQGSLSASQWWAEQRGTHENNWRRKLVEEQVWVPDRLDGEALDVGRRHQVGHDVLVKPFGKIGKLALR